MAMVTAIKSSKTLWLSVGIIFIATTNLYAAPFIETSRSIGFTQTLGDNKTVTGDESINITTITPQFSVQYNKSKVDLNLDYSLVASRDNTEKESDVSHLLNLATTFTHIPNVWVSRYSSSITQKNTSDTGRLVSNALTTTDASESYIAHSLDTSRTHQINNNLSFSSSIEFSSQGFKNESSSQSASLSLGLNVKRILPSISLESSFSGSKNLDTKETNNSLSLISNYLINTHFKSYLSITSYSSNNNKFNEDRYAIGLDWTLSPTIFINVDAGQFGGESSWSTNSLVTLRRTTISLNHSEKIATLNQSNLDNLNNNSNFGSSISADLAYVKNTILTLSHRTRRMTMTLSLSKTNNFSDLETSADRTDKNTSLALSYQLNSSNSISYSYGHKTIITTINNQLDEHSVKWESTISRHSRYNVTLSFIEQNNDDTQFDSKRTELNFNYTLSF